LADFGEARRHGGLQHVGGELEFQSEHEVRAQHEPHPGERSGIGGAHERAHQQHEGDEHADRDDQRAEGFDDEDDPVDRLAHGVLRGIHRGRA